MAFCSLGVVVAASPGVNRNFHFPWPRLSWCALNAETRHAQQVACPPLPKHIGGVQFGVAQARAVVAVQWQGARSAEQQSPLTSRCISTGDLTPEQQATLRAMMLLRHKVSQTGHRLC